jgi:hypothetical protein
MNPTPHGSGVLGDMLGGIACWCDQNKVPPLTSLVVNEKTGLSGEGIPIKKAHTRSESTRLIGSQSFLLPRKTFVEYESADYCGNSRSVSGA